MTDSRPTYPPEHHVLRDLAVTTERVSPELTVCSCPLVPAIAHASGRPRVGALAAIIDLAGAATALSSVRPDWIATADLSFTSSDAIVEGPIVVAAHLVRAGSNVVVVRVDVGDGRGSDNVAAMRPAGRGLMTFARIPGSASAASARVVPATSPKQSMALPHSGFRLPLFEQLAIRVLDATTGTIEIDRTDYTRNSFGSLNGGVTKVSLVAALLTAGPSGATSLALGEVALRGAGEVAASGAGEVAASGAGAGRAAGVAVRVTVLVVRVCAVVRTARVTGAGACAAGVSGTGCTIGACGAMVTAGVCGAGATCAAGGGATSGTAGGVSAAGGGAAC